jgi:ferredoxin
MTPKRICGRPGLGGSCRSPGWLAGMSGDAWNPAVVRPPGSLPEAQFLQRCIKCGQCMRICPTNVIHPAGLQAGIEGIWTPMLNFRMGTSGCQQGCIACGNLCPTAAIRPISLDERLGKGDFASRRPDPHRHGLRRPGPLPALGHGPALHRLPGKLPGEPQGDLHPRIEFRPVRLERRPAPSGDLTGNRLIVRRPGPAGRPVCHR